MPPRGSIYSLPKEIREELERRLVAGGFADYDGLAAWLKEQGCEISRSAVHRHGQKFEARLSAIKIATEQARAIATAVGDEEGVMGDALTRLCQEKAFKVLIDMEDPDPGAVDLSKMGVMISRLNRVSIAQKKWMSEAKEKARSIAEDVATTVKRDGLSAAKAEEIRKKILISVSLDFFWKR
ncbi:MAG: DUF3486 family protein [Deltaproteobacteria bacterium]|nr:DUF3486 family protein [Deltaproteobacteria bacterium]